MAYIANTAFEQKVDNAVFSEIDNITGLYQNNDTNEDCSAGFLCVASAQMPNEGYPAAAGMKNANAWIMEAATVTDHTPVYACNPGNVNRAVSGGNTYKIGANTLGLRQYAGEEDTFTRVDFDKGICQYRFGIGNLSATLSTNTFFTIVSGLLVPSATAPATAGVPYFELLGTGTFTQGASAAYDYVDVVAKRA